MEINVPTIQSCAWYVAKDTAYANEYEDAFQICGESARASIADGVSSAIFSAKWAQILTRHLVESPANFESLEDWIGWLKEPRDLWLKSIDLPHMPPHQKNKLRQVGGAFCTMCFVEFETLPDSDDGLARCRLKSYAFGDSCLLHIRSGKLLTSFPLATSAEFDLDPQSICSVATSRDKQQTPAKVELECLSGDLVILVTDAIAKWMLASLEGGTESPWEQFWGLDNEQWAQKIEELRNTNQMKRDDTTLVALQFGDGVPIWQKPKDDVQQTEVPADDVTESMLPGGEDQPESIVGLDELTEEQIEGKQHVPGSVSATGNELHEENLNAIDPVDDQIVLADSNHDVNHEIVENCVPEVSSEN